MFTESEEKILKTEMKGKKKSDIRIFTHLLIYMILAAACYVPQLQSHTINHFRWFPDTWTCSCGYENYEGIGTCAVCGKARK